MKTWTKVLIGAAGVGTLAAGVIVARNIAVKKLTGLALARIDPDKEKKSQSKSKGRISGTKPRDPAEIEKRRIASQKLKETEHQVIEMTAFDGVNLVGHYFKAENAKRVVIAMHGWRSAWDRDLGMIADFFFESGCSVLFVEQRGQNASGGDFIGMGVVERFDCRDWAKYIDRIEGGELPIYLYGLSMGAATVLMSSGLDMPSSVCGIIADCGFTSPKAIWKHVTQNNMHIPYFFVADKVDKEYKRFTNHECNVSCLDALATTDIPVLFIHGTDDKFVPVEMTYENYQACASDKDLLIIPGAGHVRCHSVDQERYEGKIFEFFSKHDNK